MKMAIKEKSAGKDHLTGVPPRPVLTAEERIEQHKRDKEFMRIMNEIVAEHGMLTDDEFFRVL
ncbi:MAG: hypothetical protein E7A34_13405 [Leclercia adecarboxylata]|uniref:hypothetical protein n=1 Tax=Leclercia TaxID=83654 RepID=UPI0012E1CD10|nr:MULTISPECIES: hypothetical protein [Leclercia]MDU1062750.1 hypothetical protein [Leclercia adecarboxylata]MDU1085363.1 hypothetical protein [Leclercia adecarboxylata]QGU15294.1 hypothetical protein GNG27_11715 [Leclercia sp. 119287]